jgi:murein peptide amidase A
VLRALTLALLLTAGGERFENPSYGHTVAVPAGWTARLGPDGATTVATYRVPRLDRWEQPPPGHVRLTLNDYGRQACPRDATRAGQPVRLVGPAQFEGFHGYTAVFCRGGHSLQAFVLVGRDVAQTRVEQAREVVASLRLTPRAARVGNVHSVLMLGRSLDGRPIRAWRIGNPSSPNRLLVVGCIHGNECAGLAVTQRLVNLTRPVALDVWVIQNLNPDGLARKSRGNARGVDLNRDFDAFSQRESRIARDLIRRLEPDVTVWFHQPQAVVRAWGPSRAVARRYAQLAGEPYRSLEWPPGAATRWQNGLGQRSFVVELRPGELPAARADRHARALLQLLDPRCCSQ